MEVKPAWQIRLFDTLEIESPSGVVTAFAGTKAGGILAYLALHLGSPVTREEFRCSQPDRRVCRRRKPQRLRFLCRSSHPKQEQNDADVTERLLRRRKQSHPLRNAEANYWQDTPNREDDTVQRGRHGSRDGVTNASGVATYVYLVPSTAALGVYPLAVIFDEDDYNLAATLTVK